MIKIKKITQTTEATITNTVTVALFGITIYTKIIVTPIQNIDNNDLNNKKSNKIGYV